MPKKEETVSVAENPDVFATAKDMAKKRGMRRKNDMTTLRFGQPVLMVTSTGITVGSIRSTHGQEDGYRYDIYILNETKLCSFTFDRILSNNGKESHWAETPVIETGLPEGAVLYAGPAPKNNPRSTRKPGTRYQ